MNLAYMLAALRNPGHLDEQTMRQAMLEAAQYIEQTGKDFPIPGTAGLTVKMALNKLAMTKGPGEIMVRKEHLISGKYIYLVEHNPSSRPAEPQGN